MTALPRVLEPEFLTNKLLKLLDQTEVTSNIANFIKNLAKLTESITANQEGVYKDAIGFVNKHQTETTNVLDKGIDKAEKNKSHINESLADGARQFQRNAPEDTQQRYPQLTSPTSTSQR